MRENGWVVLRRENGSAETIGQVAKVYDNRSAAEQLALELANKTHGQKYVVAKIVTTAEVIPGIHVTRAKTDE